MSGAGDSETPSVSTSRNVRPPIGKSGGASSACNHGVDQRRVVGREDAEAVADHVVEAAVGEIELDVPGFLVRARLVEAAARQEGGVDRDCRASGRARDAGAGGRASALPPRRHPAPPSS